MYLLPAFSFRYLATSKLNRISGNLKASTLFETLVRMILNFRLSSSTLRQVILLTGANKSFSSHTLEKRKKKSFLKDLFLERRVDKAESKIWVLKMRSGKRGEKKGNL